MLGGKGRQGCGGVKKAKDKEKWGVGKISKMVYGNARNRAQNERERERVRKR